MTTTVDTSGKARWRRLRMAGWTGLLAFVLLTPLAAMQFTREVNWTPFDFVFAAGMVLGVAVVFELAAWKSSGPAHLAGVAVALAATFLLIWINGAVGLIGDEGEPANLLFFGVLAVGILGSVLARFRPGGMALAMVAAALAQGAVAAVAVPLKWGSSGPIWPLDVIGLTGFFGFLWLLSAALFWSARPPRA